MTRKLAPFVLSVLVLLACGACRAARPSDAPAEGWIVSVRSARLPESMPWYTRFARHTWIDAKRGSDDAWVRVEVEGETCGGTLEPISAHEARVDWRWRRPVEVHGTLVGAEAERAARALDAAVAKLGARYAGDYRAWPGPNSNTFVRDVAREIGASGFAFDHDALGKDWYGIFGAGLTPSNTGMHVDLPGVGLALAAREGVELHLLGFVFGVQLWPPRLELPALAELPWAADPPALTIADEFGCDAAHVVELDTRAGETVPAGGALSPAPPADTWLFVTDDRRDAVAIEYHVSAEVVHVVTRTFGLLATAVELDVPFTGDELELPARDGTLHATLVLTRDAQGVLALRWNAVATR